MTRAESDAETEAIEYKPAVGLLLLFPTDGLDEGCGWGGSIHGWAPPGAAPLRGGGKPEPGAEGGLWYIEDEVVAESKCFIDGFADDEDEVGVEEGLRGREGA